MNYFEIKPNVFINLNNGCQIVFEEANKQGCVNVYVYYHIKESKAYCNIDVSTSTALRFQLEESNGKD